MNSKEWSNTIIEIVNNLVVRINKSHSTIIVTGSAIAVNIIILDLIHCPTFYLNHIVSETEFCNHLKVEPIQLGPIDRDNTSPDTSNNISQLDPTE